MTLLERFQSVGYRGPGFDIIRLLAATAVLVHHSLFIQYDAVEVDILHQFSRGFIHLGFGAVAVFFVISGFLVTPGLVRSRNVIDFGVRRITRIYPALIVLVLAIIFIVGPLLTKLPVGAYFADPMTRGYARNMIPLTQDFLPGVTLPDGTPAVVDGSLWTLFYEVLCYLLLGAASLLGLLRWRWLFAAVFALSFATNAVAAFGVAGLTPQANIALTLNGLFLYFAAGVTLFLFADMIPWTRGFAAGALVAAIAPMPFGLAALISPAAIAYIVVYLGLSALPLSKRLADFDLSYGVYLVHGLILAIIEVAFPELRIWWVVALIVLPITLAVAYCSWTFIEHPILSHKSNIAKRVDRFADRVSQVLPPVRLLMGRSLSIRPAAGPAKGE